MSAEYKRDHYEKHKKNFMLFSEFKNAFAIFLFLLIVLFAFSGVFFYQKHMYIFLLQTIIFIVLIAIPDWFFIRESIHDARLSEDHHKLFWLLKENKRPYSFQELAEDIYETSKEDMLDRLDRVLDTGAFPEYYLNYALEYLMFNHDLDHNDLEEPYLSGLHKAAYPCVKCGGISFYQKAEEKICKYCAQPLVELTDDEITAREAVIKTHSQKRYIQLQKRRKWSIFALCIYLICAGYTLIRILGNKFSSSEETFILAIFFLVALISAIAFFAYSIYAITQVLADCDRLKQVLNEDERPISIKDLALKWNIPEIKVIKKIDRVLDYRLFPDMYFNETIGYFLFKDDLKNDRLEYNYLEKYELIPCSCKNCGARNYFRKHQNGICAYCGHPITF